MRFPLLRLPIALVFVVPVFVAQAAVWGLARQYGKVPIALISVAIACGLGWAAYALYTRWVEKRAAHELGGPGALRELGAGLAFGAVLFASVVAVLALLGVYRIVGLRSDPAVMLIPLCVSVAAAVIEEILMRGVVFRLLEASLGTWIALVVSASLFGAGHVSNPNASLLAAFAIAIEAGVLLAAAYLLTRRLWFAIGIHAAWNFTQGGIFGLPTSGIPMNGILISELTGPQWLTGGAFGVEASAVAFVLASAAGVVLLVKARRRGRFVAPFWQRADPAVPAVTAARSPATAPADP